MSDPACLQAAASASGQQSTAKPSSTEKEAQATEPQDPPSEHKTPPPSDPTEPKASPQRSDGSSKIPNVTTNSTKKRRKSRRDEQTDGDADEEITQARATKRPKIIKAEPRLEPESTHDDSTANPARITQSNSQVIPPRPLIDSYRPLYSSNRPTYPESSAVSVSRQKSRATAPFQSDVPQGPRKMEVPETRHQEVSISRTPFHGGIQQVPGSQTPYRNGRQSINHSSSQSSHQNVIRASKPPHIHDSRYDIVSGARTPGHTQANHGNQGFGGCTTGHTSNQTWGNAAPHSSHQQRHNQAFRGGNNRRRAFSQRGATVVIVIISATIVIRILSSRSDGNAR